MSKYSTEEFINWLGGQISIYPYITPVITKKIAKENEAILNAIISRLWAADKLCEEAKKLGWMIPVYPHIGLSKISKAIAEYEGKP